MNVALVSIWHNGGPGGDNLHHRYFQLWKKCVEKWKSHIHWLYLIDSDWNFTEEDRKWMDQNFPSRYSILRWLHHSHWDNMEEVMHHIAEPYVMITDLDMYIYQPEKVRIWLQFLEGADLDVLSIWDGSGGVKLDQANLPMKVKDDARRIAPYLMLAKTKAIRGLSWRPFNQGDIWFDSFGQGTRYLVENNAKLGSISDNRMTLNFQDGVTFSDNENLGYYHIRNWSRGVWMVRHNRLNEQEQYKTMMPGEAMRLLGWFSMLGKDDTNINQYVNRVVTDFGFDPQDFWQYVDQLKEFHPWVMEALK